MLGVLGLGSFSTLSYLKLFNEYYQKKHGGYSTCPFVLLNADFDKINPYLPFEFDELKHVTRPLLDQLISFNVEKILIPNITLNFAGYFINIPQFEKVINPFDILIDQLKSMQITQITFLGTRHMMTNKMVLDFFAKQGIELINVEEEVVHEVDDLRQEVYTLGINERRSERMHQLINSTFNPVIGCSELSMLNKVCPLDLLKLQVEYLFNNDRIS